MLQAVLQDFQAWGEVRTLATLDSRLIGSTLMGDQVVLLEPRSYTAALAALLRRCDAALVIAPESAGTLSRLSARVASAGIPLLGSSAEAISIAGDKWACSCRFESAGLPMPVTRRVTRTTASSVAAGLGFPLVVKPLDGAGCIGVALAADEASLEAATCHPALDTRGFLLQRYIPGAHASVSLLTTGDRTLALSLNKQSIHIDGRFTYHGGTVPFEHPQGELALELAADAVNLIPGLRGYVGVDLVLTDEGAYLIEVNPRLTSSYVGLRPVISLNLAQSIWNASFHDRLPDEVIVSGSARFGKEGPCTE